MSTTPSTLPVAFDSQRWLARWDAQQAGYLPDREARFTAMLDMLDVLMPPQFVALDLCCGPGSLSQRLLTRFPEAQVIALDFDPVLLALGQAALGAMGGRLRWAEGDLNAAATLPKLLGTQQIDAVLSTTALHWLSDAALQALYQQLARAIRPDGLFLNGDNLNFPADRPLAQRASDLLTERLRAREFQGRGVEDWAQWWAALRGEPGLTQLIDERERRFAQTVKKEVPTTISTHEAALRAAGFREVGPIWQHLDNVVLMAVR
jgi:trans-aconitate methyltransferase